LKFDGDGAACSGHFGDGDLAVDVDLSADVQRQLFAQFTVHVEDDTFAMDTKVHFVPFLIEHLSFAEDERLQFALEVGDAELDGVLARIERDLELRTLPDVADADDVPGRLGRFARPERADERELVGQPLREDGPGGNDQIGLFLHTEGRLEAAGATYSGHTRILGLQDVEPELADEVEGLQIVLARPIIGAGPVATAVILHAGHGHGWCWSIRNGHITATGHGSSILCVGHVP